MYSTMRNHNISVFASMKNQKYSRRTLLTHNELLERAAWTAPTLLALIVQHWEKLFLTSRWHYIHICQKHGWCLAVLPKTAIVNSERTWTSFLKKPVELWNESWQRTTLAQSWRIIMINGISTSKTASSSFLQILSGTFASKCCYFWIID